MLPPSRAGRASASQTSRVRPLDSAKMQATGLRTFANPLNVFVECGLWTQIHCESKLTDKLTGTTDSIPNDGVNVCQASKNGPGVLTGSRGQHVADLSITLLQPG